MNNNKHYSPHLGPVFLLCLHVFSAARLIVWFVLVNNVNNRQIATCHNRGGKGGWMQNICHCTITGLMHDCSDKHQARERSRRCNCNILPYTASVYCIQYTDAHYFWFSLFLQEVFTWQRCHRVTVRLLRHDSEVRSNFFFFYRLEQRSVVIILMYVPPVLCLIIL